MPTDLQHQFDEFLGGALLAKSESMRIAVAVSGGSDSMALCLLAKKWCDQQDAGIIGLTVDHGLRIEAADEARNVATWLASHQIDHQTLMWSGPHPKAGIQEAARDARYDLMLEYCRAHGIRTLLLGHQLEDQLETMLMRLSKGSGLAGIASMAPVTERGGVHLVRPLLSVPRRKLRHFLMSQKQDWVEDPSNENPDYTRTRVGAVLQNLIALPGSELETVGLAAQRLTRAADALAQISDESFNRCAAINPFGYITLQQDFYHNSPDEIALRVLERVFALVRGNGDRPKLQSLETLLVQMQGPDAVAAKTINGCQIKMTKAGWVVSREAGRKGLPSLPIGEKTEILWDDRFLVTDLNAVERGNLVAPLGTKGWQTIREEGGFLEDVRLPASIRNNLPAIWAGTEILAVPHFSYVNRRLGIASERFKVVFTPKIHLI